jgi:hypothetical protein
MGCDIFSAMSYKSQDEFGGVNATASLWVLLPRLATGIITSGFLITLAFWLRFGEINSFTILLVVVSSVFQVLILIGLRFGNRTDLAARQRPWRLVDYVGAFWLIAVFFGAFAGWFTRDYAFYYPDVAIPFHVATVILTIVLPVVTSIPNYRYVTATNAYITIPLLAIVTLLPSLIGFPSAIAIWQIFNH